MAESNEDRASPRPFQYGLRTLFVITAVFAVWLAAAKCLPGLAVMTLAFPAILLTVAMGRLINRQVRGYAGRIFLFFVCWFLIWVPLTQLARLFLGRS